MARLAASGMSNRAIAAQLGIDAAAVKEAVVAAVRALQLYDVIE